MTPHPLPIQPLHLAVHGTELHYGDALAVAYTGTPHTDLAAYVTAQCQPIEVPRALGGGGGSLPFWPLRCRPLHGCEMCRTSPCITVPIAPPPHRPPVTHLALGSSCTLSASAIRLPHGGGLLVVPPGATLEQVKAAATAWSDAHSGPSDHRLHVFWTKQPLGPSIPANSYVVLPITAHGGVDLTRMFAAVVPSAPV